MTPLSEFGKVLILFGILFLLLGGFFLLGGKIPWIGRLPGDIIIHKKNTHFYFPLVSCLLISLLLSFLFSFFGRK